MKGYFRIHGIASCKECNWREEDFKIVTKEAKKHNKKTGHGIDIELGFWREIK